MKRGALFFAGALLFTLGLGLSYSEVPTVLGRWSTTFAGVIGMATIGTAVLGVYAWRTPHRGVGAGQWTRAPLSWLELASVVYGAAYLTSALGDPDSASRALDLNLTGAIVPAAVLLEWAAMACAVMALMLWASRIVKRYPGLVLTGGSILAMFLLLEGGARLLAIVDPQVQGFPTNRSRMWRREFVRLNQAGFRDVDHAPTPAPGTHRLLVIGDSYAMGEGINDPERRFGTLMGKGLAQRTGQTWEVLHDARSDTHTLKHLEFLAEGLQYRPDVVLLLYVFNDIDYLRRVVQRTALTEHPQSILDRLRPDRLIFVNSFAYQELYLRFRQLSLNASATPPADPYADSATVATHLADLQRFVAEAKAGGAPVVIVPFDIGVTVSDRSRNRYEKFLRNCAEAGLPVVSLRTAFDGHTIDDLSVNRLDRHPNELANRLAEEAVLEAVVHTAQDSSLATR